MGSLPGGGILYTTLLEEVWTWQTFTMSSAALDVGISVYQPVDRISLLQSILSTDVKFSILEQYWSLTSSTLISSFPFFQTSVNFPKISP